MAAGTQIQHGPYNAYPCVAKLARAEFPACQAALDEFNGLAVVQAWRSQPAPPGAAGASGDYAGAAAAGAAGADGEAAAAAADGAMQTERDEVRGTATVAPPTPAIATKLVDACACTSVHMCRARVYGVCGGSR